MSKKKRYTKEEDAILLQCIKEKKCILHGAKEAAKLLPDRDAKAMSIHYHKVLVNKPTIIVTDRVRVYRPRKPKTPGTPQPSQITYVMRKMLDLKPEEREKILNFFK